MRMGYFEIVVKPHAPDPDYGSYLIHARTNINGVEHAATHILEKSDLENRFDQIFEFVQRALKEEIFKYHKLENEEKK